MTAVPHEGLRRGSSRSRAGSRVVRPSQNPNATREAKIRMMPGGVAALGSAVAGGNIRLVWAGRRFRLGNSAFVLFVLGLLSGTLLLLLTLNTSLAEDSFRLTEMKLHGNDLLVQEETLNEQLAAIQSPVGLEERAIALGMVSAGTPTFLRLSDNKVIGKGNPALMPPQAKEKKKGDKAAEEGLTKLPPGGEESVTGGEGPAGLVPSTAGTAPTDPDLPAGTPGSETSLGFVQGGN